MDPSKLFLEITCVIFSFAAAIFWLLSALVKIPDKPAIYYKIPESDVSISINKKLNIALIKQSKISAIAAICAAMAALSQTIAIITN